jgi:hypothetical protein
MADQPLDREHDGEHRDDDLDSTDGVESPRPGIAGLREEEPAGAAQEPRSGLDVPHSASSHV